jgi:hypothetical protein
MCIKFYGREAKWHLTTPINSLQHGNKGDSSPKLRASLAEPVKELKPKNNRQYTGSVWKSADQLL